MDTITIIKGRDKDFLVRLTDEDGRPVDLTNWTVIKARFLKEDDTALEKHAPLCSTVNEIQKISFNNIPDAGTWTISVDGILTSALAFNANSTAVQAALNLLDVAKGCTVSGNYSTGFSITMAGASAARPYELFVVTHTLKYLTQNVVVSVTRTQTGVAESGVAIVNAAFGEIRVKLSEADTIQLARGLQDFDLYVRILTGDLNIPPKLQILDIQGVEF